MGKIDWHYDPYAAHYAGKIAAQADKISNLASGLETTSPLTGIGKSELAKIAGNKFGDTFLAGVARNSAARDIQAAKDSMSLGTAAMRTGANNPNSLLSHQRMLNKATSDTRSRAADFLARAMPGYISEAGSWANTDNDLLAQRIAAEQGATGALGTAAGVMSAGTIAKEKKGFWSNLFTGLQAAAGIASAIPKLSDERAKENIRACSDEEAAKKVKKLKVKRYKYKPGMADEGEQTGVMAQDVEKVLPEAVSTGEDGLKRVDYRSLFMTNVGATKHLMERVERLEKATQKARRKSAQEQRRLV